MCGIAGFWQPGGFSRPEAETTVKAMTDAVVHRGPDSDGHWLDADAGIALGHRRLAILDLSPAGAQPMGSRDGRFQIVFNGEIYNHLDLRDELPSQTWRGTSDTETLLASLEQWGLAETLERATGMFAFALWDRRDRVLSLARDRMGEKPLYWGWQGDMLVFGSELKAIRRHPKFKGELNRDALHLYLRHNYIPSPYSVFHGIHKLPPGTYISLADPKVRIPDPISYWSAQSLVEGQPDLRDPKTAVDELERVLGDAVEKQALSDVPLGAFLSGGVDSSTIVALMAARLGDRVRTFTIGFEEDRFNESDHAAAVAAHLGTRHECMTVTGQDALDLVDRIPRLYDEPFADSSQIPTVLVSRIARQHVTVALSGDGADELFGGYTRYQVFDRVYRRLGRLPMGAWLAPALLMPHTGSEDLLRRLSMGCIGLPRRKLHAAGLMLAANNRGSAYVPIMSRQVLPDQFLVAGQEPRTPLTSALPFPATRSTMEHAMFLDTLTYLPGDILQKVDRAAMATSLETRAPFLDPDVVRLAWRMPHALKGHQDNGKWVLKQVLKRHVPSALFERPKMGFGIPVANWLRGPLKPWGEDLLDPTRIASQGIFKPEAVHRQWREHQAGTHDWHAPLWGLLVFQAWLDQQH